MSKTHIDLLVPRKDNPGTQTFRAYCQDGELQYLVAVVTRGQSVYERWVPSCHHRYKQLKGMAEEALREKRGKLAA